MWKGLELEKSVLIEFETHWRKKLGDLRELNNIQTVENANLFIDYKADKPKNKMSVEIAGTKISDSFTDGMIKQYNLMERGYLFTFKDGRKRQNLFVVIAPGDKPVKIHCVRKRKLFIEVEQSEYASRVVKRLCHDSIYLKFLRFNDKWTKRFLMVYGLLLGIPMVVILVLQVILFTLRLTAH